MRQAAEASLGDVLARQPVLPVALYRVVFRAAERVRLPDYAGSMWRGAFGHALKRTVCAMNLRPCPGCMLEQACVYPYMFETPVPPDAAKMRRYTRAPQPFVLTPPFDASPWLEPDAEHAIALALVGRATRYVAYAVHALARAGEQGVGRSRHRLALDRVEAVELPSTGAGKVVYVPGGSFEGPPAATPSIPAAPRRVVVRLLTPLRLRRAERLVTPEDLAAADLLGSLVRRVSMLTCFHTDTPLEADFLGLKALAAGLPVTERVLRWHDWTRWSSRQKTEMQMGGIVGELRLDLAGREALWPYLWLGQWVHAGKGATMGLGAIAVEPG